MTSQWAQGTHELGEGSSPWRYKRLLQSLIILLREEQSPNTQTHTDILIAPKPGRSCKAEMDSRWLEAIMRCLQCGLDVQEPPDPGRYLSIWRGGQVLRWKSCQVRKWPKSRADLSKSRPWLCLFPSVKSGHSVSTAGSFTSPQMKSQMWRAAEHHAKPHKYNVTFSFFKSIMTNAPTARQIWNFLQSIKSLCNYFIQ